MTTVSEVPDQTAHGPGPITRFLFVHEIDEYPRSGRRTGYLALAVIATIVLYYTYYTQTGVTPNILNSYHMSFTFYVWVVIVSNLIGAFASLLGSFTDRLGRSNVVIYGLLIVGLLIAVAVPNVTGEWGFFVVICAVGFVEGVILVATPALVRDFSPQLGRASAMGFWTVGPVAGSLLVSIVANHTLSHFVDWQSQFIISGITSLVAFLLMLLFLKDLSSKLRDQLMVSTRDRALVEARARGVSMTDLKSATEKPWRQIFKWDLIGSSFGISMFLLIYFLASAFFTIYYVVVFKNPDGLNFTVTQANGLNTWFWTADVIALIVAGAALGLGRGPQALHADRHPRGHGHADPVPDPGGQPPHRLLHVGPHVVGSGHLPLHRLRPVDGRLHRDGRGQEPGPGGHGPGPVGLDPAAGGGDLVHLPAGGDHQRQPGGQQPAVRHAGHPEVHRPAPPVGGLRPAAQGAADRAERAPGGGRARSAPARPPANIAAAIKAVGPANFAQLVKYKPQLTTLVQPYTAQLNYLSAHQAQLNTLQEGINKSAKQWQHWFWIDFAGMVVFIPLIFLTKGRWSPSKARADRAAHEQSVNEELARLSASPGSTASLV